MTTVVNQFRAVISALCRSARLRGIPSRTAVDAAPRALAVMGAGPGRDALQGVFRDAGWQLVVADSPSSAFASQQREPLPLVLYERELTERGWRQIVSLFSRQSPRPCVVLMSRSSDRNLWEELVRCGGFDLLRIPVDRDAVIRTVRAGWFIWQNQHTQRQVAAQNRC
jgi:DNA-binding NtrC family response regulator